MRIATLLKLAPIFYQEGVSVHLISKPGIGKSNVIEQEVGPAIQSALNLESFGIHMPPSAASIEAFDVRGFTIPAQGEDGRMVTKSTVSPFIPAPSMGPYGIVFADEVQQGAQDVNKALAPGVLDGRYGEDMLPEGWVTWQASNRMKDRSGTTKPLMHKVNREAQIHLEFHIDDWTKWAMHKLPVLFIGFAKFKPGMIAEDVPKDPDPFCTPRSYSRMAKMLERYAGGEINADLCADPVALEIAISMVGKAAGTEAMAFMRVANDLPSWRMVQDTPDDAAKSIPKGRLDVVHSATTMVVHNVDAETIEPAFTFVENLPKEFQTATLKLMLDKLGGSALNHPKFKKWVTENSALITSSFV